MLKQKIILIEKLFKSFDLRVNSLRSSTGFTCPQMCDSCCQKENIYASVIEFLPLAYHLYKNKLSDEIYSSIESSLSNRCILYNRDKKLLESGCLFYLKRGLICRGFGFSVRINKKHESELIACTTLKSLPAYSDLITKKYICRFPLLQPYYVRLYTIYSEYAYQLYPINEAMKIAIEIVENHFFYNTNKAL